MKTPLNNLPILKGYDAAQGRCVCGAPFNYEGECIRSGRMRGGCDASLELHRDGNGEPFDWCLGFGDMIGGHPNDFLKSTIKEARSLYFSSLKNEGKA